MDTAPGVRESFTGRPSVLIEPRRAWGTSVIIARSLAWGIVMHLPHGEHRPCWTSGAFQGIKPHVGGTLAKMRFQDGDERAPVFETACIVGKARIFS